MIEPHADRPTVITLGADKANIDWRTTRHRGHAAGQRIRKRIEEAFGWIKMIARQEKP
jgi:hypothetical protein